MSPNLSHPVYIAAKAALAALVALTLVNTFRITDQLSACFVAVVCTSPTVYSGFRRGFGQLLASALGGTITLLLSLWVPPSVTLVVALFAAIWVSFLIRIGSDYVVAAFTVLYVLLIPGEATLTLEHRLASVAIGVFSATLLNLAVSFARRRKVFGRRLRIARELVADELERTARVLEGGGGAVPRTERLQVFESAFQILRTLSAELSDAAKELGASRRWRTQVQGACAATEALLAVAHFGKDLLYALDLDPRPQPATAVAVRQLAAALRESRDLELTPVVDEAGSRALPSAAQAWRRAHAGLEAFTATGG